MAKKKSGSNAVSIFAVVVGCVVGFLAAMYLSTVELVAVIVFFALSLYLHIIIHEGGHLLFGLLTGYGFVSFRIGSFQWTKKEGKLRFGRLSVGGTSGQCLMSPPQRDDGKMPVVLYNLGGSMLNLIFALGALILLFWIKGRLGRYFIMYFSVAGGLTALVNGIPLRTGMVDNDGRNVLALRKDPDAQRAFVVQLNVAAQTAQGTRLSEMPEDWFCIAEDARLSNGLIATQAAMAVSRFLDQGRYQEASALCDRLLAVSEDLTGLVRNSVQCDRLSCELIGENRREVVDRLYTPDLQKTMKAMKTSPSVLRTEYLYALCRSQDGKKAKEIKGRFELIAKKYPYPNDILADRALMEKAQKSQEQEV